MPSLNFRNAQEGDIDTLPRGAAQGLADSTNLHGRLEADATGGTTDSDHNEAEAFGAPEPP
jgi:hypothetical protein